MTQEPSEQRPRPFTDLNLVDCILGEDSGEIRLSTRDENRQLSNALLVQGQRSLEIFTPDLEAAIYDQPTFIEGVRQLVLQSRHVRVRILLQHPSAVVRDGHKLVEMMRRLTSYIEIRAPSSEYHDYNEAFMIVDHCGLVHRHNASRYEGQAYFFNPLRARALENHFDQIWQRSQPHDELRRMHL